MRVHRIDAGSSYIRRLYRLVDSEPVDAVCFAVRVLSDGLWACTSAAEAVPKKALIQALKAPAYPSEIFLVEQEIDDDTCPQAAPGGLFRARIWRDGWHGVAGRHGRHPETRRAAGCAYRIHCRRAHLAADWVCLWAIGQSHP